MSEEKIKDMIEPMSNWEYTYRYDGSRTCGKSYFQSLLDEKNKEIARLKEEKRQVINLIKENAWYMYKDDEEILDRVGVKELLEILGEKDE